jgi:hypothetical protein
MRALFCVVIVIGCSRERPTQVEKVVDTGAEVDLLAELLDASGDAVIYTHETTVTAVSVFPKTALSNAGETLGRERWRFRPCAAHVTEPTTANMTIRVGEGGEVVSSTAEAKGALGNCLCDAAQKLKFSEPAGGTASVEITLKYAPR